MISIVLEYPDNWNHLHQCLLMLFDSPLNHAGYLRVYIRMDKADPKKMIEMHREIRLPRTFKRFHHLLANFLKGDEMPTVETKDGYARLMTIVNKDFDDKKHQQQPLHRFRIINLAPKVRAEKWFAESIQSDVADHTDVIIFVDLNSSVDYNVLGEGRETEYEIKTIKLTNEHLADNCDCCSLTRYPISPALMCVKLTSAFEEAFKIL